MWRVNAIRLFQLGIAEGTEVSEELASKADLLLRMLNHRFRIFLMERVPVKSKRAHWTMEFAYNNMPVNAAVMVLSGHLPMALECLSESDCLLVNDDSCFVRCSTCPGREGAYLYFDLVRRVFVRSGKVGGRGYSSRDGEHLKEAMKPIPTSRFYRWWPSERLERAQNKGIRGHFEHLVQLVAVGYDPKSEQTTYLDRNWDDGGVLILNERHKSLIQSSMRNQKCAEVEKFRTMLDYQFELGYDLALAKETNASTNAGYEAILGVVSSIE